MDEAAVKDALREVLDPELGIDVASLGLVNEVRIEPGALSVALTMTSTACPLADVLLDDATSALRERFPDVDVLVSLSWDPPWSPERMSTSARELLGWPSPA